MQVCGGPALRQLCAVAPAVDVFLQTRSPETLQPSAPTKDLPAVSALLGFHGDWDGKRTKWQSSAGRVLGSVLVASCCDRVENSQTLT